MQPASLDLRLGEVAYRIRCSFLPGRQTRRAAGQGLHHRRARPPQGRRRARDEAAVPHPAEGAARAAGRACAARRTRRARPAASTCSPASSPTRATASTRSPTATKARCSSKSCRCRSRCACAKTSRSTSCGCRSGAPSSTDDDVRAFHREQPLLFDQRPAGAADKLALDDGLFLGLDLRGDADGQVGYRARDNAPLLDVTKSAAAPVDPEPFWESVQREDGDRVVLTPQRFYLLMSNEAVSIPPTLASEMTAYDPTSGELRTHYAGFFDPGFGYDPSGCSTGSRAALEVRAHDVPFMIEHGQRVCKLTFEHMLEAPDAPLRPGHRLELPTPGRDAEQALRPLTHVDPTPAPDASRPRRCGGGGAEAGVSVGAAPLGSLGWVSAVPPTECSQRTHNASISAHGLHAARNARRRGRATDTVRVRARDPNGLRSPPCEPSSCCVVVAHPDDETFGTGSVDRPRGGGRAGGSCVCCATRARPVEDRAARRPGREDAGARARGTSSTPRAPGARRGRDGRAARRSPTRGWRRATCRPRRSWRRSAIDERRRARSRRVIAERRMPDVVVDARPEPARRPPRPRAIAEATTLAFDAARRRDGACLDHWVMPNSVDRAVARPRSSRAGDARRVRRPSTLGRDPDDRREPSRRRRGARDRHDVRSRRPVVASTERTTSPCRSYRRATHDGSCPVRDRRRASCPRSAVAVDRVSGSTGGLLVSRRPGDDECRSRHDGSSPRVGRGPCRGAGRRGRASRRRNVRHWIGHGQAAARRAQLVCRASCRRRRRRPRIGAPSGTTTSPPSELAACAEVARSASFARLERSMTSVASPRPTRSRPSVAALDASTALDGSPTLDAIVVARSMRCTTTIATHRIGEAATLDVRALRGPVRGDHSDARVRSCDAWLDESAARRLMELRRHGARPARRRSRRSSTSHVARPGAPRSPSTHADRPFDGVSPELDDDALARLLHARRAAVGRRPDRDAICRSSSTRRCAPKNSSSRRHASVAAASS